MKKPLLESQVVKDFRTLISALFPTSFSYKNHQSGFSGAGFPDITVVIHGVVIFLEGKRTNEDLSPAQEDCLRELTAAGAITGTLRGGAKKGEFRLTPWHSEENETDAITLRADGTMDRKQLVDQIKEFVNACCDPRGSVSNLDRW